MEPTEQPEGQTPDENLRRCVESDCPEYFRRFQGKGCMCVGYAGNKARPVEPGQVCLYRELSASALQEGQSVSLASMVV